MLYAYLPIFAVMHLRKYNFVCLFGNESVNLKSFLLREKSAKKNSILRRKLTTKNL